MEDKIKVKQLELLYSHLPIAILTSYIAACFISIVIWNNVDNTYFISWLVIFNLIMIFRVTIILIYKRVGLDDVNVSLWDNLNFFVIFLTGLTWGALTLLYSPYWPDETQITFWVLLIALMAGASASIAIILKYYLAFCLPIVMLSIYSLYTIENYHLMAILIFYILLLSLTTIGFRKKSNIIIAQQLELLEANVQLESLATRDSLTNLPNRRAFEEFFENEWERHTRSKKSLSLMMIDVDYFKDYNDHYGHTKGDDCLRSIARIIHQSLLRPSDRAARYGGEEFIITLPETPRQGALEVASRIHDNLRNKSIPHEYSSISNQLTVSIGVATLVPSATHDSKVLQLLADRELYKAKASGRNCTSYDEEEEKKID